jgi:tRNA modification GTPase
VIFSDTIAAVATAPGRAGVAVVRVSGPDAAAVARALGRSQVPETGVVFRRLYASDGAFLDEALVLSFKAPRSYTGEDTVEFQCHGGAVTPRRVLEACLNAGARLARRGEFTERAFLNGKIDYSQAEAVIELIEAKTVRAADRALAGLDGSDRADIRRLYDEAVEISATIEHSLDVDEGELPEGFLVRVGRDIAGFAAKVAQAIKRRREGRLLSEGALVVLAGPPNAGKSSLMNALLGENRAIVSDVAGTTRDSIEEWLDIEGWPVRLTDTAGIRDSDDTIEQEGVRRAESLVGSADVVVWLGEEDP